MLRSVRILAALAFALVVGSCYLPARFDAEVTVTRAGYYTMKFDGYLVDLDLYGNLKKGTMLPAGERDRVEILRRDFERDSATKEFQYFKQGHFKVRWESAGDLTRSHMVSFVRRNENMISLSYVPTNHEITVRGTSLSTDQKDQILAAGLNIQGQIRVITDARVVEHNATKVTERDGKPMYVWQINSARDPSPRMVIILG